MKRLQKLFLVLIESLMLLMIQRSILFDKSRCDITPS